MDTRTLEQIDATFDLYGWRVQVAGPKGPLQEPFWQDDPGDSEIKVLTILLQTRPESRCIRLVFRFYSDGQAQRDDGDPKETLTGYKCTLPASGEEICIALTRLREAA